MDKRIAVNAFKRRCNAQDRIAVFAEQGRTLDDEERAQPFSAVQHAVAHGCKQSLRASHFSSAQTKIQKPDQHCLDFERTQVQGLSKIDRHVFHAEGDGRKR